MLLDAQEIIQESAIAPDASQQVYRLEAEILKQPQVHLPIDHQHCAGLYARTMFIPEGTVATGAIHRNESFFVVRHGTLVAHTEAGPVILPPGHMAVTQVGQKRAVVALTDVVVTTFHANPTAETDPDALWALLTVSAPGIQISHAGNHSLEQS